MFRQKSATKIASTPASAKDTPPPANSTPHPSDMLTFVPYACLQLSMPFTVRFNVIDDFNADKKKGKKSSVFLNSSKLWPLAFGDPESEPTEMVIDAVRTPGRISLRLRKVTRQLLMVLELAAPYCSSFDRLIIPNRRLFPGVLRKITDLLRCSSISELFLDGSTSYDDKYNLLLESLSNLRVLSLDRCDITDGICIKLAAALKPPAPASNILNILSLANNKITDTGATALGRILRTNRSLYHLNLSGNSITDVGACDIIHVLGDFCLTNAELLGMRRRYVEYLKARNSEYQKALKELESRPITPVKRVQTRPGRSSVSSQSSHLSSRSPTGSKRSPTGARRTSSALDRSPQRNDSPPRTLPARAEALAKARVGTFTHIFTPDDTIRRNTDRYCRGNRKLKSLSLAYTEVTEVFIDNLVQILRMQSGGEGLVRVQVTGAPLPATSKQLEEAEALLKLAQDYQINHNFSKRK